MHAITNTLYTHGISFLEQTAFPWTQVQIQLLGCFEPTDTLFVKLHDNIGRARTGY